MCIGGGNHTAGCFMEDVFMTLFPACEDGEHAECIEESDLIRIDRKLVRCSCLCHTGYRHVENNKKYSD